MNWQYTLGGLAQIIGAALPEPAYSERNFSSVSTDTRTIKRGDVFFALRGERFDGNAYVGDALERGAVAAVAQADALPGQDSARMVDMPGPVLTVGDPLAALQAFAGRHRAQHSIPLLAITGSCGKTTAKDLAAAVLGAKYNVVKTQGNLNNDIGCPLSLLQIQPTTGMAVIEMGANHPGEIAALCTMARPTEAAITMIAPAHLEGFGSVEGVAKAKAEIVGGLNGQGVFYVNTADPRCVRIAADYAGPKVFFGPEGEVRLDAYERLSPNETRLVVHPVGEMRLPLKCRAHATNVLLAIAAGLRHGVEMFEQPLRSALEAASRFRYRTAGGIHILDDSYNANPASVRAALEALAEWPGDGRRLAVLGDMLELGPDAETLHGEIGAYAAECGIDCVLALGVHARAIIRAAEASQVSHVEAFDSHQALADALLQLLMPGDVCLVKGSRGMQMERIIEALEAHAGTRAAG